MMAVPLMLIIDKFFEHNDPDYERTKYGKRKQMILLSVISAFFWGLAPLFGWSKISYEPSKLSCSVFEDKPGNGYIFYMVLNFTYYYILPLFMMIHCKMNSKNNKQSTDRKMTPEEEASYSVKLENIL